MVKIARYWQYLNIVQAISGDLWLGKRVIHIISYLPVAIFSSREMCVIRAKYNNNNHNAILQIIIVNNFCFNNDKCYGCGAPSTLDHFLICMKGGLIV